ncbi:MAG: hypothetical protein RLZZ546_1480 [Bacteroidota bacterium]
MKLFTIFIFLLFTLKISSQNLIIQGKILDDQNNELELATVDLLMFNDSTKLKSLYSEIDGRFLFNELSEGSYLIQVSYLSYKTFYSSRIDLQTKKPMIDLGNIKLEMAEKIINGVTITAKTPYIERKVDRTIVNVDALISNAGSSTYEALEKSPGISTDQNGNIKLKGKTGVQIFIDDKPTYLNGSDLESYLRSLPAGSVKQIEIMPNPPAKYEAAGNAGIINIITKRNKLQGFNGNAVAALTRGKYTRTNNSLNFTYNAKKFSVNTNINAGFRNTFQDLNINRYYKNIDLTRSSSFRQNSYIEKFHNFSNAKIGLDYFFNEKTTLGLAFKGAYNPGEDITNNKARVLDKRDAIDQYVNALNTEDHTFKNATYSFLLRHNIDSLGSNIGVDADYVKYSTSNTQFFDNVLLNKNNVKTYADSVTGNIPTAIDILAFKIDYTKPLADGSKFEAGIKTANTKTNNEALYTRTILGKSSTDFDLSNKFLYDEWINAAYVNYSTKILGLDWQLGLRGERTSFEGEQLGNEIKPDSLFTRSYLNIFPTLFAQWVADTSQFHTFSFSFGRRIDRPYFQDLNPFVSPLDRFTFYSGNPNLLPTYSNNFTLSYTFKSLLTASLNYAYIKDGINETLEIVNGIYYSRPGNIDVNKFITCSLEPSFPIGKRYTFTGYVEFGRFYFNSKLYTETLNTSANYLFATCTNSFQFGKGWSAEMRGDFQGDAVSAQLLIKSWGTLNFAFQKKLFKDVASIKLSFNDVLYTRRADGIINNLRLTDADWDSDLDTRNVNLALSYRFGKANQKRQKINSTGSQEEQNRVKN